jgi:hypothetical protein
MALLSHFPRAVSAKVDVSIEQRSMAIYDPWPIRRPEGGGVVAFRVLAAEDVAWSREDQFSLLISGREVPIPWISAAFVEYINPADRAKWRDYSIPLTKDTERLTDGDRLIVTLKDPRHLKSGDIQKP